MATTKNWHPKYLTIEELSAWDDFVNTSPQATIYGKSWYLSLLEGRFRVLTVQSEGGGVMGGIVLAQSKRGEYLTPLFAKYLGVYFSNFEGTDYHQESLRMKVVECLLPELQKLPDFDYLFHPDFSTYLPFHAAGFYNQVRYTFWLDLKEKDFTTIEQGFYGKLRTKINRAGKAGLQVTSTSDVSNLITLYQQAFTRKGSTPPLSSTFLDNYLQFLLKKEAIHLLEVHNQEGKVLAAAGLLQDGKTVTLIMNGMDYENRQRGANELLLSESIRWAIDSGYQVFDFEGSMLPSIATFYRQFGGQQVAYLNIYKKTLKRSIFSAIRKLFH